MRRPNGYGTVTKLSGTRRCPYAVRVPCINRRGHVQQKYLSYHATAGEAQRALDEYTRQAAGGLAPPPDKLSVTLADVYGITVNDFLVVHIEKQPKLPAKNRKAKHWLVSLLSFGLVWFVATIVMVIGLLIRPDLPIAEYAYIVALPASMIVAVVFCCIWGRLWMKALSVSALVWSFCVMIDVVLSGLSGISLTNSWLIYVVGAALQLLVILWYLLRFFMKRSKNSAK